MAEVVERSRYRDQSCEPESSKTYLQDGRSYGEKGYRNKEIPRYGDTGIQSYRDMGIPRYRDQARKRDIPRLTEVPKDHDTESRETRIQEEYPRSPQDGPKTGQDGPKMAPSMAKMAPRWPKMAPKTGQDVPKTAQDGFFKRRVMLS